MPQQHTQPARGMRDFLPDDIRRRQYVIDVVRRVYERYGFDPLETPALENIETLTGKYGEEGNKLIYKVLRRGEGESTGKADLALRYDLTVALARRSAGARAIPRVLPVRCGHDRVDLAGGRSGNDRGGQRRPPGARLCRL